jgi:DNA-binding transcriptional LysR family regulator
MDRRITLHQLTIFSVLARHLNMTRAAAELHMTTPALSIQIKQLSKALGAPLHEQIGRKIYLTDAGRRVEAAARDILERLQGLTSELVELQGMEAGSLRISIITTAKYFVPRFLGEFCRQHPGIDVSLDVSNRDQCLARLSQNLDDLYIMGQAPEDLDVTAVPFMENRLVVIAPAEHPLANKHNIDPKQLAEEWFIMREQGSGTRLTTEQFFKQHKITIKTRMTLGSNEAVKQAVAGGLGLAVLSQHTLTLDESSGAFAILNVKGFPLLRKWYAIYPKGKVTTTITKAFLDHLIVEGGH